MREDKVITSIEGLGLGIDATKINKLFNKLYRSKQVMTKQGLDIGLAIYQKIIVAHGSAIGVESINNKSITFRFT